MTSFDNNMKINNSKYNSNNNNHNKSDICLLPSELRSLCRKNEFNFTTTAGQCPGYVQGNLVILPKKYAFDFLLFCQRNPKPCPLLHVIEGYSHINFDIRSDLPKYNIYASGHLTGSINDITDLWQSDFITFILGCSFSFEDALIKSNLNLRHIELNKNVPMYKTSIKCNDAGIFHGNMVVSMRPFKPSDVLKACEITSKYVKAHGAPIHFGSPQDIGINDINKPDFGDAVPVYDNEIPVFWACGVTPQLVIMESKPDICITHAPGNMLVLDQLITDHDL